MNKTTEVDVTMTEATEMLLVGPNSNIRGYVLVDNWENRRRIVILPNRVTLEVYRKSCACSKCLSRAKYITSALASTSNSKMDPGWIDTEGSIWITFNKSSDVDGLKYTKEKLKFSSLEFVESELTS